MDKYHHLNQSQVLNCNISHSILLHWYIVITMHKVNKLVLSPRQGHRGQRGLREINAADTCSTLR